MYNLIKKLKTIGLSDRDIVSYFATIFFMGLSHPVTSKMLYRKGNKHFKIGGASMQGLREEMEDAHTIVKMLSKHQKHAFFGVFDGHCGADCAKWCSDELYSLIDDLQEFTEESIIKACLEADSKYITRDKIAGSTAVFALVDFSDKEVYKLTVCNIGDSRIILGKSRGATAIPLTQDHKPLNSAEMERIRNAGGSVILDRVDGHLALSRAMGDASFKNNTKIPPHEQKVIAVPDFTYMDFEKDDFLLICCDGLFECLKNTEIIEFVSKILNNENHSCKDDLALICAHLEDYALKMGSADNMTSLLILREDGTDYEREDEFLPGYYYKKNSEFTKCYKKDCESHGYTLKRALKLIKENKERGYYVARPYDSEA